MNTSSYTSLSLSSTVPAAFSLIMVQPSPVLLARVRFTTKQVGFGFYRGNQTGSVGAHTQYGGYLVDWRKVKNYNVPDLKNFNVRGTS